MADNNTFLSEVLGRLGFEIPRSKEKEKEESKLKSFVTPTNDDGALTVESGGAFGSYLDLDGGALTEFQLITKY